MLGQDAVLDPHHVGGHPCRRLPSDHRLASREAIRPREFVGEIFIATKPQCSAP
jgi:hypothetical protein